MCFINVNYTSMTDNSIAVVWFTWFLCVFQEVNF